MKKLSLPFKIFLGLLILGLFLAYIRIPTPLAGRNDKKRQQVGEMKLSLSGLYIAQIVFKEDHSTFTTAIRSALKGSDIDCKSDVDSPFSFGFISPSLNEEATSITKIPGYDVNQMICGKKDSIDIEKVKSFCPDCTAGQKHFKAAAWTRAWDGFHVWTIDENKVLTHFVDHTQADGVSK